MTLILLGGSVVSSATYRELTWLPLGEPQAIQATYCSADNLKKLMLTHASNLETQARETENFLRRCDRELSQGRLAWWRALLRLEKMVYQTDQHAQTQEVIIDLGDAERVPALLAMHSSRRPLVILKCGVLCNSKRSIPFPLMHNFDEGPFHALFVGSTTGREYLSTNQQLLLGGFHEGQQAVRLADYMKNHSPWKEQFSSVHFLGVSLGGHGALYASLFNQHWSSDPNLRPLSSVFALCPVVDLRSTIEENYSQGVYGRLMQFKLWQNQRYIRQHWPDFNQELGFNQSGGMSLADMSRRLSQAALPHFQSTQNRKGFLAPFDQVDFMYPEQIWDVNNFLEQLDLPIETPTMAVGALDDGMVPAQINFLPLYRATFQSPFSQLRPILTQQGSHCAHSLIYGWGIGGTLMRSFFLSQSPELRQRQEIQESLIRFRLQGGTEFKPFTQFHSWAWEVNLRERELVLKLFDSAPSPMSPGPGSKRLTVPFSHLPHFSRPLPKSPIEAQVFSRWANAQLKWSPVEKPRAPAQAQNSDNGINLLLTWEDYH